MKKLPLKPDAASWKLHLPNVTFARQNLLFKIDEFVDHAMDMDNPQKLKRKAWKKDNHGVTPKSTSKKFCLYKFSVKLCTGKTSRTLTKATGLTIIKSLETKLLNASVEEEDQQRKAMEDDHLGRQIDHIFQNTDINREGQEAPYVGSDKEDKGTEEIVQENNEDLGNEDEDRNKNNVYLLSLVDVFEYGQKELEKLIFAKLEG